MFPIFDKLKNHWIQLYPEFRNLDGIYKSCLSFLIVKQNVQMLWIKSGIIPKPSNLPKNILVNAILILDLGLIKIISEFLI